MLDYHPDELYIGPKTEYWWFAIIGNLYDKWIMHMGMKEAK